MRFFVNTLLVGVLGALFVLPILFAHQVIGFPELPGGLVAGARVIDQQVVNIIPNTNDFKDYVKFNPSDILDGRYQDQVTLTSFQRQKATYRGLYTVYNLSTEKKIRAQIFSNGKVPQDDSFESISVWIGQEPVVLETDLLAGTTVIENVSTAGFSERDQILIGTEEASVVAVADATLVVTPLKNNHAIGEVIYPQRMQISPAKLVYPQTNVITIAPGDRVMVYVEVMGTANLIKRDQQVELPLSFRFEYSD